MFTRTHTYVDGSTLTVTATAAPYFSVTAELRTPRGRLDACGCLHEAILAAWPDLAPLVALHLADANGRPLHALENGRYWAGFTRWGAADVPALARHLRISEAAAGDLIALGDGPAFARAVEALAPRWSREASAGHARLAGIPG